MDNSIEKRENVAMRMHGDLWNLSAGRIGIYDSVFSIYRIVRTQHPLQFCCCNAQGHIFSFQEGNGSLRGLFL